MQRRIEFGTASNRIDTDAWRYASTCCKLVCYWIFACGARFSSFWLPCMISYRDIVFSHKIGLCVVVYLPVCMTHSHTHVFTQLSSYQHVMLRGVKSVIRCMQCAASNFQLPANGYQLPATSNQLSVYKRTGLEPPATMPDSIVIIILMKKGPSPFFSLFFLLLS